MRLWLKQTLLALTMILVSVSACLYFFTSVQTESLLRQAEEGGEQSLAAFCEHLSTLDRTGTVDRRTDSTTRNALIQYTFSTYAHLLQSKDNAYSLVNETGYLYNITRSDPAALLPMTASDLRGTRTVVLEDVPYLIQGMALTVLDTPVTVYLTRSLTPVYKQIASLTRTAQLSLGACLLLCGVILPLIFRRTLRPLRTLTVVSRKIASGQYHLRAEAASPDEVGDLSAAFDSMAATIEEKILSLEDTARRRELLLGALTHEMKTPMTAIIGFSQSLLTMPLSEEGRMDAANEIYEAARRTERLSQKMMQLIALSDGPALVRQPCAVVQLFEQVEQALQPFLAQKDISLAVHAEATAIYGDIDLLFTLLTNLIHNAVHASQPSTTIHLSAVHLSAGVRLQVLDQGSGIPADKLALVTEPFYRVDKARSRKHGGAGLGLSICQMIAEAHGSQLVIESQLNKGTTVSIDIPDQEDKR